MFLGGHVEISEEAEEIRELLYDIVKDYNTGVTSAKLESLYNERYVQTGLGQPLPKDWLSIIEIADEFEVRKMSTLTMVYIVQKNDIPIVATELGVELADEKSEEILQTPSVSGDTSMEFLNLECGPESPLYECKILSTITPNIFFVRLKSQNEEYEKFCSFLKNSYIEENVELAKLRINKVYTANYKNDTCKRVLLKKISTEAQKAQCFFLDDGIIDDIEISSIKELKPTILSKKFLPFSKCCIYDDANEKIYEKSLFESLPHLQKENFEIPVVIPEDFPSNTKIRFLKYDHENFLYITSIFTLDEHKFKIPDNKLSGDEIQKDTDENRENGSSIRLLTPLAENGLLPFSISTMPVKEVLVYVISATDPDNINIRLCSWDPMPDYLYSALARDSSSMSPSDIQIGKLYAGLIDETWERVQIIRQSNVEPKSWIVYAVDIGLFHMVKQKDLRNLGESTVAFDKMLLAKCKLSGIKPHNNILPAEIWPRETQLALQDLLQTAVQNSTKLVPIKPWVYSNQKDVYIPSVPFIIGKLIINEMDLSKKLISMGLAEKIN